MSRKNTEDQVILSRKQSKQFKTLVKPINILNQKRLNLLHHQSHVIDRNNCSCSELVCGFAVGRRMNGAQRTSPDSWPTSSSTSQGSWDRQSIPSWARRMLGEGEGVEQGYIFWPEKFFVQIEKREEF